MVEFLSSVTFCFFGTRKRGPDQQERHTIPKSVLEMLRQWERVSKDEGVLYRRVSRPDGGEEGRQLVLSAKLKEEVLHQLHQGQGHQGVERTTDLVRQRCYWPGMINEIKEYCQNCERCTLAKAVQPKVRASMGHLLAPGQIRYWPLTLPCLDRLEMVENMF